MAKKSNRGRESLQEKLEAARMLLNVHLVLTEAENERIKKRLTKLKRKGKSCAGNAKTATSS